MRRLPGGFHLSHWHRQRSENPKSFENTVAEWSARPKSFGSTVAEKDEERDQWGQVIEQVAKQWMRMPDPAMAIHGRRVYQVFQDIGFRAPQGCDKENRPRNSAPQGCDKEKRPRNSAPQGCDKEDRPRNCAPQGCDKEDRPRNSAPS